MNEYPRAILGGNSAKAADEKATIRARTSKANFFMEHSSFCVYYIIPRKKAAVNKYLSKNSKYLFCLNADLA